MAIINIFRKNKGKEALPGYFKPVLWSYNFKTILPEKDKKTIITNAVNYGDLRHWRWLMNFYGKKEIGDILKTIPATEIRPRVRNLAAIIFSVNNFNYEPRSSH